MAPTNNTTGGRLLRNLRDLQLDDELDWPEIQADTFDAKDSVQKQAQRIKKAEWVVFNLLHRWDPAASSIREAAKLFPAYESRQSLELRSTLFAQLSALKKDGVFPKDLILRKTMFDDCKGPKFEELLLCLSISVLLKVLDEDAQDRSVLKDLLLSDSNPELSRLQVLDSSYRAALSSTLADRASLRRRWQRFGRVLKLKEDEISQRRAVHERKVEASKLSRIPRRRLDRLQAHIERDWSASSEWKGIVLKGDQHLPQATLLERPYDNVWQHASEEKLYKIQPAGNMSALQTLEHHIEGQNHRLSKWRNVKIGLDRAAVKAPSMRPPSAVPSKARPTTARRDGSADRSSTKSPELGTTAYELSISSPIEGEFPAAASQQISSRRSHRSSKTPDSPSLSLLTDGLDSLSVSGPSNNGTDRIQMNRSRPTSMLIHPSSAVSISPPRPIVQRKRSQTVVYSPQVSARPSLDRSVSMGSVDSSLDIDNEVLDFEEDAATSIINSVLNAEPSPSKPQASARPPPLSLTERARMSMAQPGSPTKRPGTGSSGQDHHFSGSPSKHPAQGPPSPTRENAYVAAASLDERTRQTMAFMAASMGGGSFSSQPQAPSHSYSNSYSSRPQTARRTTVTKRASRSPEKRERIRPETPPDMSFVDESLLDENVDEDTIFMSRPRIAHSPPREEVGEHDRDDVESVEDFS